MAMTADQLPDDPDVLKAMVLARDVENARLTQIIKELQRHRFGRRAESLPEDQLLLGLEEAEQIEAAGEEEAERADPAARRERTANRRASTSSPQPAQRRSRVRRCGASQSSITSRTTSAASRQTHVVPCARKGADRSWPSSNRGCARSSASSARRPSSPRQSVIRCHAGQGLARFLDDGRVEIDSNTVERSIRPMALNRKNALFASYDGGAEHWAVVASPIETCKLNDVEPLGYLTDVLARIVKGHPNSQIDNLLPWAYIAKPALKAVA